MMKAYVYILQSIENYSYYIGSSTNVWNRLKQHNNGQVKSTKYKRPYKLVFYQEFDNIDIARKIEYKIKSWKRKDFIDKIIRDKKIKIAGQ